MHLNAFIMRPFKPHQFICSFCGFIRPNCTCAISTRVANDNENSNTRSTG